MPPPIVCFADFDYPRSCESWAIVPLALSAVKNATGTSPEFRCVNPAETALVALVECSVILGLETRLAAWIHPSSFVAGPAYNVSWGLKVLVENEPNADVHGWDFLRPFTWEVWVVFASCAIAACCSQLLMRWLDIRRRKTSPDAVLITDETVRDVALASFTSLIGSSRLFEFYEGPYMRHVTSMIMAVFSMFIMSLYSSNLTAFSFPESEATTARSLTDAREYAVHRGFVDYARRGMTSVMMNTDSTIREISIMGDDVFSSIAPDAWLASRCTPGRRLLDVFPMVIIYEVIYNVCRDRDEGFLVVFVVRTGPALPAATRTGQRVGRVRDSGNRVRIGRGVPRDGGVSGREADVREEFQVVRTEDSRLEFHRIPPGARSVEKMRGRSFGRHVCEVRERDRDAASSIRGRSISGLKKICVIVLHYDDFALLDCRHGPHRRSGVLAARPLWAGVRVQQLHGDSRDVSPAVEMRVRRR